MKKAVIALIVLAVAGLLGWQIYGKISSRAVKPGRREKHGSMAVAVEIAAVRRATLRDIGRFTGSLRPRSQFVVAPKIVGRLEKLTVDVGDTIKSGQLIAELDDDEYAQHLEQARAELAVAKANVAETKSALDVAERELVRAKTLHEKRMASDAEKDEAEARHTAAQAKQQVALAQVKRREAALKAAEVRLSYTRIHASWEDADVPRVVGERFVDEGEMLRANAPIVSILDNTVMIAVIDAIERDYPKLNLQQQATITTDAFPDREFTGAIVRIAPLLKETSRQARVEIEIPNAENVLKPGMFVRVRIEFDRHKDTTVVPVAALARRETRQGVFAVDKHDRKARFVPVTLGITEGELIEVVEPPLSGFVVTMGHHLLEDGAAVRLPEAPPEKAGGDKRRKGGGQQGNRQ